MRRSEEKWVPHGGSVAQNGTALGGCHFGTSTYRGRCPGRGTTPIGCSRTGKASLGHGPHQVPGERGLEIRQVDVEKHRLGKILGSEGLLEADLGLPRTAQPIDDDEPDVLRWRWRLVGARPWRRAMTRRHRPGRFAPVCFQVTENRRLGRLWEAGHRATSRDGRCASRTSSGRVGAGTASARAWSWGQSRSA